MAGNTNQTGANLFGPYSATLDAYMVDSNGYMYYAKGTGVPPTTASIFAHGCKYIQTDSGTGNVAEWTNTGSTAVPSWNLIQVLPSSATSAAAGGGSIIQKTSLTSAQILALNSTPIVIANAPGTGNVIIMENVGYNFTPGNATYTGTNTIETRYTDGSGVKVMTDVASSFINTTSATALITVVENGLATNMTAVANASVVVVVPSSNPAAGTGTMVITAKYRIASQS